MTLGRRRGGGGGGPLGTETVSDRQQWKALMEGYVHQWMDNATSDVKCNGCPARRGDAESALGLAGPVSV